MPDVRFAYPVVLFGLLALPALLLWRRTRGRTPVRIVPHAAAWAGAGGMGGSLRIVALYAALALLIVALARPQRIGSDQKVEQQGYDLMLAIDLSTSMLSEDYQGPKGRINRLETIRPIIRQFIARRPNDRIGIAVFARRAITLAPLTTDHGWLARQVATLRTGLIEDGTAIGDGLGVALNNIARARGAATDSGSNYGGGAFIILLTDGSNNSGDLTPAEATALARFRRIPVYTVGTGRNGMVPFPVFAANGRRIGTSQQPSALDIDALKTIAAQTGGRFFMAGDTRALAAAFAAIDAARKARFSVRRSVRVDELFPWFALPAMLLLVVAAPGLGRPRQAVRA
ncbi:VWA domain-containing protein [Sandarakinorhabdus rubra]|uniref:VWA domain-containing protein n=1 Tax=Sandarakinorhabdus rubra TaxID=2672568 RepID=UPI0013DCAC71|nr:VWA domain-containing protein [Sandarakinorhabdus rubra]